MKKFNKISSEVIFKNNILSVDKKIFQELAEISFTEMRKFFREEHLQHWHEIMISPESSDSEKEKMKNNFLACIEAKKKGVPYCQDTGVDIVYISRGDKTILTGKNSLRTEIQNGALLAREKNPYRNSIFIPDKKNLEINSGNNTPPEIHFFDHSQEDEITGIFSNKGGGSGSKFWSFSCAPGLYQDSKKLLKFIKEKIAEIGHSACPPYEMSIILGGLSHLDNSKLLTQTSLGDYSFLQKSYNSHEDRNPGKKNSSENFSTKIIQDKNLEKIITQDLKNSDMGAQGKGKFFLMPNGLKIFRAPRHAAHFFIGIGVGCSAHRIQSFKINKDGIFLETLCKKPEKFLEKNSKNKIQDTTCCHSREDGNPGQKNHIIKNKTHINLNENKEEILKKLQNIKSGEEFLISGEILGARDKAHARWRENFETKKIIPEYLKKYLSVFYVGPADTPKNEIIGSFGPTTAGRMDEFSEFLFQNQLIPLSIAKGTRSKNFAENCKKYKGMFCAIQGGPAAYLRNFVKSVEIIDFEDLGMEAVRLYQVEKIPVQMIVDSSGDDFYKNLSDSFLKVL